MVDKKKKRGNPNFYKGMPAINPAGRPKGSINKWTQLSREMLTERGPEIVEVVIAKALKGDVHCLKMCMDRIVPQQKAVEIKHTINVGSTTQIEEMARGKELIDVNEKTDDEVIAEVIHDEERTEN